MKKDGSTPASWRSLAASTALLVLAILLAAGLIMGTLHYADGAGRMLKQIQAQQSESRSRLARVREDELEIRAKIDRYHEVIARGRTQPERRLDWVETLRGIKERRRLIRMDYEIAPQRPLDPNNLASGSYRFLVSPMKLDMQLLHENDLLGLLADLESQVQALVSVRQCMIERLPAADQQQAALLSARCDIDWITLQEKL